MPPTLASVRVRLLSSCNLVDRILPRYSLWCRRASHLADILVADDNKALRDMLQLFLKADGYTVYVAADGKDALDRLRAHPTPMVAVLDWHMPHLDGIQVLYALAADASQVQRHALILVTAASMDAASPLPPLPPGMAVQVLSKPFDLDAFGELVGHAATRLDVNPV